jgi:hypothetical protein
MRKGGGHTLVIVERGSRDAPPAGGSIHEKTKLNAAVGLIAKLGQVIKTNEKSA